MPEPVEMPQPPVATMVDPIVAFERGDPVRVLGVWAHPDDEAYLSAGLMARVARNGGRVVCMTATRGELGVAEDDGRSRETIERLREAELRASLRAVGAQSLRILGYPDGGCADVPHEQGVAHVSRVIEAVRPDLVVTFGADGITGHPDHLAVHRWVTDAWQRTRSQAALLYAVMSEGFVGRYDALHRRVGVFGDHEPVGYPAAELALTVELADLELDRKRLALAAHASQTTALAEQLGEATYRTWWASETFLRPAAARCESREIRVATAGAAT